MKRLHMKNTGTKVLGGILLVLLGVAVVVFRSPNVRELFKSKKQEDSHAIKPAQAKRINSPVHLDETANKVSSVIRGGAPLDLLAYWSDAGVGFEPDATPLSSEQFRKQIEQKTGYYCILFDSDCLRKEDREARLHAHMGESTKILYSYRDLLGKAKSVKTRIFEDEKDGSFTGQVNFRVENGEELKGNENQEFDFIFAFEKENWKLVSVIHN